MGNTNCRSESGEKQQWHQRWWTAERDALGRAETFDAHLPVLEKEVGSVWQLGKDRHDYWPVVN